MASDFPKSPLELELNCLICLNLFSDPVTLHCGHSFCLACLEKNQSSKTNQHHCPNCKVVCENAEMEFPQRNLKLKSIVESYKAINNHTARDVPQNGGAVEVNTNSCERRHSNQEEDGSTNVENTEENKTHASSSDVARTTLSAEQIKNRLRLAVVFADLQAKTSLVNDLLAKAKEKEAAVKTRNENIRAEVRTQLEEMVNLLRSYSTAGTELLESELKPREEDVENRVQKVLDLQRQLKETEDQVFTLLDEQDEAKFSEMVLGIEAHAASLIVDPLKMAVNDPEEKTANMASVCVEMERRNHQLRLDLGAAQRRLRAIFNPSEVTFNPETLHPSLVLSEDFKTVSFSVAKQPYPAGLQRFTSFLQALSSQSFSSGEHCWGLKAEGCSWVLGVCYGGLPRSGSGSGLESNSGSWCLMWYDNLLRAYEGGRETPLKRTPFLQNVEIRLSFNSNSVAFYSISSVNGAKTHLHTYKVSFSEPVFLAVRIMSGQPKAQITICN